LTFVFSHDLARLTMSAVLSALPDLPKLVEPITVNGKRLRVAPRVNLGYM
jgi:hypothetical protein